MKLNKFWNVRVAANQVGFAGVGHNFNYQPGGGNNGNVPQNNVQNPMAGNTGKVPNGSTMQNSDNSRGFDPNQSKLIPGKRTQSNQDPNDPRFQEQNANRGSSPLDKFKGLFQNSNTNSNGNSNDTGPNGNSNGKPNGNTNPSVNDDPLSVDLKSFQNFAKKLDFKSVIKPESLEAIGKGGEGATQALTQILNDFGQHLFSHTMNAATTLSRKGLEHRQGDWDKQMREVFRTQSSRNEVLAFDNLFQNPDVEPIVSGIHGQIAQKFPDASPQELKDLTLEYLKESFGPLFKDQKDNSNTQQEDERTDFVEFFKQP